MDVGIALPQMAEGYDRSTTVEWCRRLDESRFTSVSAGERITYRNQSMLVSLAAAAALTESVEVLLNLAILPWHRPALLATELATLDVLSNGRLTVGVGVGGREEDFRSIDVDFRGRHAKVDAAVGELRRLWSGEPPYEGAGSVGPPCVQPGGPPILAGALGPKSMRRAAQWADGVSGFSLTGRIEEMAPPLDLAEKVWAEAGRDTAPRKVTGFFFALGPEAEARLRRFIFEYLAIFDERVARSIADSAVAFTPDAVAAAVANAEAARADHVILVPGSADLACMTEAADVVASL